MYSVQITKTVEIEESRIKDLLDCAFEGGINYWAKIGENNREALGDEYLSDTLMRKEGYVWLELTDVINYQTKALFKNEMFQYGLERMAEKYPWHLENFIKENEDAETGDVFIQCCVFGRIIFG